ncbi:MAG: SAM-dependent chlorinase/fluorinase [Chitinophagaceae bacterium]|nr:SAM-dependent chlorinase/fluorinase [Chitinophagaceae bacterium]
MPLITLTSDFGLQGHLVSSVKGKLYAALKDLQVVDVSHAITPFNLQQAVFIFKQSYIHFPHGTFHFILNDLFAHADRKLLYVYEHGQHIFCADNGFLPMLFDDKPVQLFQLSDHLPNYDLFSVVDLFISNTYALLHENRSGIENIDVNSIVIKKPNYPFYSDDILEAQVLYIDHYGNVILNIQQAYFEEVRQGRKFKILFMRDEEISTLSTSYNEVPEGEKLCMFNSSGYLEIAINKGYASKLFGFQEGTDRSLFYNHIKIFFA